jgi:hypothetical protein
MQMRGLQPGPINTFPRWKDLGRFVKRGERALTLCMPITCKRREGDSGEEQTFTSFVYKARWFTLGQTDRQELEPITIPKWFALKSIQSRYNQTPENEPRQPGAAALGWRFFCPDATAPKGQ